MHSMAICKFGNMQYAWVIPWEMEKLASPYTFYGIHVSLTAKNVDKQHGLWNNCTQACLLLFQTHAYLLWTHQREWTIIRMQHPLVLWRESRWNIHGWSMDILSTYTCIILCCIHEYSDTGCGEGWTSMDDPWIWPEYMRHPWILW